jgi:hypothetical protein
MLQACVSFAVVELEKLGIVGQTYNTAPCACLPFFRIDEPSDAEVSDERLRFETGSAMLALSGRARVSGSCDEANVVERRYSVARSRSHVHT